MRYLAATERCVVIILLKMEQKAEEGSQRVASPLGSSGFQSRCLSRPSENEYTDRSKLVSQHPPAISDVRMGMQQIMVWIIAGIEL